MGELALVTEQLNSWDMLVLPVMVGTASHLVLMEVALGATTRMATAIPAGYPPGESQHYVSALAAVAPMHHCAKRDRIVELVQSEPHLVDSGDLHQKIGAVSHRVQLMLLMS